MSIKSPEGCNAGDIFAPHSRLNAEDMLTLKDVVAAHSKFSWIGCTAFMPAYVCKVGLLEARKEEINIQACDQTLVICPTSNSPDHARSSSIAVPIEVVDGKRRGEEEGETDTWHKLAFTHHCCDGSECKSDKYRLEYTLPKNAKVEQAKASMDNGVLTVTIPKEKLTFRRDDIKEAIAWMEMKETNHTLQTRVSEQAQQIAHLEEQFTWWCDDIEEEITWMKETNHTLQTRVSEQAQQIVHLKEQAVEARETIELGNQELAQAIKRKSHGSTFLLILWVLLAFCFSFGWYN